MGMFKSISEIDTKKEYKHIYTIDISMSILFELLEMTQDFFNIIHPSPDYLLD